MAEQPMPRAGGEPVLPSLFAQLEARRAVGIAHYGVELTTTAPVEGHAEAIDELLDALMYVELARMRHQALVAAVRRYREATWAAQTAGAMYSNDPGTMQRRAQAAQAALFALVEEARP